MIRPALQDDEFLADVRAARAESEHLHLWWLGQSGFLVQWQGHHLLLDPYLSDSLTHKYAGTDRPHTRMTERVVAPERLTFINAVTASHNHTDHCDRDTLLPLLEANPKLDLIVPEANREFVVNRLEVPIELPRGLDVGKSCSTAGFVLHGVPAAHPLAERDAWGRHKALGYIIQAGPWTLYHSGDTLRYEGMEDSLSRRAIDVALLPINGNRPERGVPGNLDGREAATLAKDIGARLAIPCHYDMFEFNTASPEEFTATARQLGQPYQLLRCGERWSSTPLERPG
jgi:L-ascorbate metabolism protein UlaG (beta-lactamase superfamily)